ncbi:MAG: excinuclease ABC subunit UvrC [Clostridiales bacterium]|nr:excinuclease ABC subunit UvrC [Clostridiales bacterium]
MSTHIPSHLRQTLQDLPELPGVYIMKDSGGQVIYVGKAQSLKNRVRSYFQSPETLTPKTAVLVGKVAGIEIVVVDSPRDALILESNLIKEHRPRYNVVLRDDKHYPYLMLTMREDFPHLLVVRRAKADGNFYFGPYVNVGEMRSAQKLIEEIFPLRSCNQREFRPGQRACLNAHIGRCPAPCEKRVTKEEYASLVDETVMFLQGRTKEVVQRLRKAMQAAAAQLNFEEAARLREHIKILGELQEQQQLDKSARGGNRDFVAVAAQGEEAVVQIFFVRQGKVVGREHFLLQNAGGEEPPQIVSRFLTDYYGAAQRLPGEICLNHLPAETEKEGLEQFLSAQRGGKLVIMQPQRGDKLRLLRLVEKNARLVLEQFLQSSANQAQKAAQGLEELRLLLSLPRTPQRLECYDISHIQGACTVGSMAVFQNGLPSPKDYRRFRVKTVEGVDDFASLREVLGRRFRAFLRGENKGGLGEMADLLVIDGGKGQLSSVMEVVREQGLAEGIKVISLAKQFEWIFLPETGEPLVLPKNSPALQLLQRLRDEAHRFALAYHRQVRGKGQTASVLEEVRGVGPKKRERLLRIFGSLAGIKAASVEELRQAGGLDLPTAEALYKHLHPES